MLGVTDFLISCIIILRNSFALLLASCNLLLPLQIYLQACRYGTMVDLFIPEFFTKHGQIATFGTLKVNLDVSIEDCKAGYVIRIRDAKPIQTGGKVVSTSSVPFSKLIAAWIGVKVVVMDFHASYVWLEGDSITFISWIEKFCSQHHIQLPILQDLWVWKSTLLSYTISRAYCQANQVAGYLAALHGNFTWSSLTEFDAYCLFLIQADAYGSHFL